MSYSSYSYIPSSLYDAPGSQVPYEGSGRGSADGSGYQSGYGSGYGAAPASRNNALSVTAALNQAKSALESFRVCVMGEVSEVNAKAGYKAVYFTIKDAKSSLPCMMWNNRYAASGVQLRVGMRVELTGRFSLYTPKGRMNFDVSTVRLAGEGDLRKKVADLARKLHTEGLTAPEAKKPLPYLPHKVGVVTSPRGAAVHDVLRTLRRRFPLVEVAVAGVPVEGPTAPAGMIAALQTLARTDCEVILLVRGGGSFEDLMPFNDEKLARAVFACPIPVVTGIGHEPDTTICDMVSDRRASTPTAAAESVVPAVADVIAQLDGYAQAMNQVITQTIHSYAQFVAHIESRPVFKDAHTLYATESQTLDYLQDRLSRLLPQITAQPSHDLDVLQQRLGRALPNSLEKDTIALSHLQDRFKRVLDSALVQDALHVEQASLRLSRMGENMLKPFDAEFALRAGRLHNLSPLAVLGRGYAMAQNEAGTVVSSISSVKPHDTLQVTVSDGTISCQVTSTQSGELH